jgi:hypothetical protein
MISHIERICYGGQIVPTKRHVHGRAVGLMLLCMAVAHAGERMIPFADVIEVSSWVIRIVLVEK